VSEERLNNDLQEDSENEMMDETVVESSEEIQDEPAQGVNEELVKAREEIEQLRDTMLRAAAENENFKKRMERERLTSLKYAGEMIFREILPVVDNLERAVEQGVVEGVAAEKNLEALLEGVQLTLKSLLSSLEKFEVKPVESVGQPFDPKIQEALTMDTSDSVAANHVISEFEKGYYYKDRLLRAAKVIVSSGAAEQKE
jgi:molecular chaperone GrpE